MSIYRYLVALLVAPVLTLTQPSLAQDYRTKPYQRLARSTKPAVVRIWNTCYGIYTWKSKITKSLETQSFDLSFRGTGFLINPNGYIVTSSNVLEKQECRDRLASNISRIIAKNKNEEESKEKIKKKLEREYFYYYASVILPNANVTPLPFTIKESGRRKNEGSKIHNDVAIIKIPVTKAPTLELGDSNQVKIQDWILTLGYPHNADINHEQKPTSESYYEASMYRTSIASTTKQLEGGYPVLQIDIQPRKGSGGSPLFNEQGKVIGMLVEGKSWSEKNKTTPFAIPTSTIKEFISTSGTTNDHKGATDQLYSEGLDLFLKGNYKEARAKFLKVKRLFKVKGVSAHSEIQDLIDEIDQIEADWWAKPWTNPTYQLIFGLVVGGGIVAVIVYLLLRYQSSERKVSLVSVGILEESDSVSTNSSQGNGFGGLQSWLELEYQGQIRRFHLDKDEHRLGRDSAWSEFNIPTSWEVISRHHAILRKEGENYRIYDGDGAVPSRNGLWIDDDIRIDSKDGYPLVNGDKLKIGKDPHEQITLTYYNPNSDQAGLKTTKMAN